MFILNRLRIVISVLLFPVAIATSFYLLSYFLHNSMKMIFILSLIVLLGFWFNKKLENYTKKELEGLNRIFEGIQFPKFINDIRRYGGELFFPLVLLAIGADPIGDLVKLQPVSYQFNYIFFDIAIFILFVSFIPSFIWMFYVGLKDSVKNYW
jgi:hypothetical protein